MEKAKEEFLTLVQSINDLDEKKSFLKWVEDYSRDSCDSNNCLHEKEIKFDRTKADVLLSCIKATLKKELPLDAVVRSEKISFPTCGEDANLNATNCVHVDAFLYEEGEVDKLVDEGKLSNSYCIDCQSKNIADITFITHSASKKCLEFIFRNALPNLKEKTVLDVGSRLGVVLYAAHVYSEAQEIIGVEINKEFCDLQREILQKFKLNDRCKLLEGDIKNMPNVVKKADVIILNNVFEWFLSPAEQTSVWRFLYKNIKKGCTIVAGPPLSSSLQLLDTGIDVDKWVEEICFNDLNHEEFIEEIELKFYTVL